MATVTADPSGNYSFSGLANGTYTVTPSQSGYLFTPSGQSVIIDGASVTAVNFTGQVSSPPPNPLAIDATRRRMERLLARRFQPRRSPLNPAMS